MYADESLDFYIGVISNSDAGGIRNYGMETYDSIILLNSYIINPAGLPNIQISLSNFWTDTETGSQVNYLTG